jgi:hypothetical protein
MEHTTTILAFIDNTLRDLGGCMKVMDAFPIRRDEHVEDKGFERRDLYAYENMAAVSHPPILLEKETIEKNRGCFDSIRYRETSFAGFLVGPPLLFERGLSYLNAKTYSWMP